MSLGEDENTSHVNEPPKGKRLTSDVLMKFAAEVVVASIVTVASAAWVYFGKDLSVPVGVIIFTATSISATYLAVIAAHHYSRDKVTLSKHGKLHILFFAMLAAMLLSPFPTIVNNSRTKRLRIEFSKARILQRDRIQIYSQITDSLQASLRKPHIDAADLFDLLHFCVESVSLTKPLTHDLRSVVFYVDPTGRYLVVPPNGYYGYALDQDIRDLYFDVSPQEQTEVDEAYLERLGVAGWSYVNRLSVHSDDVASPKETFRYKRFPASQRDKPDRAMICVGIPNLDPQRPGHYIGILAVSSLTPGVLTDNDLAIAHFFAVLLGRFNAPVDTPSAALQSSKR